MDDEGRMMTYVVGTIMLVLFLTLVFLPREDSWYKKCRNVGGVPLHREGLCLKPDSVIWINQ